MTTKRPFTHIDTWVFDLDNTLYPHHVNLWQQVDRRIGEFIGAWLKVSPEEARRIQKDYYRRYGTSMRGMMTEHGVRADDYLAYVHQIDHSPLEPNPAMGAAIAINFQPTGFDTAAITGDFVLIASEVNPVIKAFQANGIEITALHSHMLDEQPRVFFMHFWANDDARKLATGLRAALDKVDVKK